MHFFVDIAGPMEVHDAHDAYSRLLLRFGVHRTRVSRRRVWIFAATSAAVRYTDGNSSNDTDSSSGCCSAVGHCRGARASAAASAHGDKPSRASAAAPTTSRARAAQGGSENQQRRSGLL